MNKQLWIDLLETLVLSIKGQAHGPPKKHKIKDWIQEQNGLMHNRIRDLEMKVEVLQSHRSAISGLSTHVTELVRRVTELEKLPMAGQDLATVFESMKGQMNELFQFRQVHRLFHEKHMEPQRKNHERRLQQLEEIANAQQSGSTGDTRDGSPDKRCTTDMGHEAGGGEGAVPAPGDPAGVAQKDGEAG